MPRPGFRVTGSLRVRQISGHQENFAADKLRPADRVRQQVPMTVGFAL